jgi:hypothetical protein
MIELQLELNSLKECGRKFSHYGIMCTEILKNHVYHPHVSSMECAGSLTHDTYFSSCQRCACSSRDNHYSLLEVLMSVDYFYVIFFIFFITHDVERALEIITFSFVCTKFMTLYHMAAQCVCISPVFHCTPHGLPQVSGCVIIHKLYI